MADNEIDQENEVIEPQETEEIDVATEENPEQQREPEVNEFELQIPDESDSPSEPEQNSDNSTIRQMRARIRELEQRQQQQIAAPVTQMPTEPSLEDCDYDEDKFKAAMRKYHSDVNEFETHKKAIDVAQQRQQQRQVQVAQRYQQTQAALGAKDFRHKEEIVESTLPEAFQTLLLNAADDSGKVVYFLGQAQAKEHLDELSKYAEDDEPIKFIKAVADLERKITVSSRKVASKPAPDSSPRGGVSVGTGTKTLDKLREEALKTGDFSKVAEYKRQQNQKAK